ncbi:MAG: hypothetical protein ICV78_18090 [Tolypothrix sp. Co-bin9]|nr:hypothetical protein [Tolypothrix sp. Co-bin9]
MRSLEGGGWKSANTGNSLATYPTSRHVLKERGGMVTSPSTLIISSNVSIGLTHSLVKSDMNSLTMTNKSVNVQMNNLEGVSFVPTSTFMYDF